MKKTIIAIIAIMAMISCNRSNPFFSGWDAPYGIPPFEQIQERDYLPAVKEGIARQQAEIQAIIDNPEAPDFENVIAAMDRSGALLGKVIGVLFNVSESDSNDNLNKIVETAMPLISEHSSSINMNAELFAKVKAVYEADQSGLSREQQMLLKDTYDSFVENGIGLDAAGQEQLKAIDSELATLGLTFGNNLLA